MTDEQLLVLVSRGDLSALEKLYDRHIAAAWSIARHFSADAPAAERAIEAAFLDLWRRPEPGAAGSVAARLLGCVHRECSGGSIRVRSRGAAVRRRGRVRVSSGVESLSVIHPTKGRAT